MDGRPTIRPGSPLTEGDYRNLLAGLAPKEQPGMQWMDPCILAKGMGKMVWWSPPMHRSLFFRESKHNAGTFDGKGSCACPGLVFLSTERALHVYAFKGDQTPGKATALYQAPFFNVWSTGQVCVGNAAVPPEDRRADPTAWEQMFFGSYFTHPNFTEKDRLTRGVNPTAFWAEMVKKPKRSFPEDVLVPLGFKVESLLEVDFLTKQHARPRAQGEF